MNCNDHVFCKMIFSNKFGFILETVFSYKLFIIETTLLFVLKAVDYCNDSLNQNTLNNNKNYSLLKQPSFLS